MVNRVTKFVADIKGACYNMPAGDAKDVLCETAEGLLEDIRFLDTTMSYGMFTVKCLSAQAKCDILVQWLELVYDANEIDEATFTRLTEESKTIKEKIPTTDKKS